MLYFVVMADAGKGSAKRKRKQRGGKKQKGTVNRAQANLGWSFNRRE